MLFATNTFEGDVITLYQRRQRALIIGLGVVQTFLIHLEKARIGHRRTVRAKRMATIVTATEISCDRINRGMNHLTRDGTSPDERIELELIVGQVSFE